MKQTKKMRRREKRIEKKLLYWVPPSQGFTLVESKIFLNRAIGWRGGLKMSLAMARPS